MTSRRCCVQAASVGGGDQRPPSASQSYAAAGGPSNGLAAQQLQQRQGSVQLQQQQQSAFAAPEQQAAALQQQGSMASMIGTSPKLAPSCKRGSSVYQSNTKPTPEGSMTSSLQGAGSLSQSSSAPPSGRNTSIQVQGARLWAHGSRWGLQRRMCLLFLIAFVVAALLTVALLP